MRFLQANSKAKAQLKGDKPDLEAYLTRLVRRVLGGMTILTIFVVWALFTAGVAIRDTHETSEQGVAAKDGLCALREDLNRRIIEAQAFIAKHPDGFRSGGIHIPAGSIRQSIMNQKATYKVLGRVGCSD